MNAKVAVNDVITDAYRNPAIVIAVDAEGIATSILQLAGSDRGRITYAPRTYEVVTGANVEWALRVRRDLGY